MIDAVVCVICVGATITSGAWASVLMGIWPLRKKPIGERAITPRQIKNGEKLQFKIRTTIPTYREAGHVDLECFVGTEPVSIHGGRMTYDAAIHLCNVILGDASGSDK